MKLKFSIHYNTAWGESLHIRMEYRSQDGTVKSHDYTMLTEDGNLWTLDTAALESRQHPVSEICYAYEVQDADGKVLRREWDMVPRRYYYDSTHDYTFPDQWHERPLCHHLYTNAYATMTGRPIGEQVEALRLPLFRHTLVFRISAPQLKQGQAVAICGSHPAIGSWNTSRYLRMEYVGQHEWMLSVNALGMLFPLEYKYVIVDDKTHSFVAWEEGENRVVGHEQLMMDNGQLADGSVIVQYGEQLRISEDEWRAAGVAVPVFALRSEHSCGVGDFGDLRRLVDWAVATGMKVIQLLPVNDTTLTHRWGDSYPYNIVSCFALHPHYLDLEALGTLKSKVHMTAYQRQRQELNALSCSDYEAVDRVKLAYIKAYFEERGQLTLQSKEYQEWAAQNEWWLKPYVAWKTRNENEEMKNDTPESSFLHSRFTFLQYTLHLQLKAAADYARSKGVVLKGDLPIGVNRESVETTANPEFFHLDMQAGAPPDAFSVNGQNWGFPTYNWETTSRLLPLKDSQGVGPWFRRRLCHMEQYFDALRIDHVLGYFRIWEIPVDAVHGVLGHFSPALPLTVGEIEYFGMQFRRELYTQPYINDRIIERTFGIHAQYVREHFLLPKAYGLYDLKEEYRTQRLVERFFEGKTDEHSVWIRDGLYRVIANVLFVEDPRQPEMYHPRIGALRETIFQSLSDEQQDAYMRLYNNYFYQRHNFFWGAQALKRLPDMFHDSRMLVCAEDLGMLPDCVQPVLDELRILSLEIQSMPKLQGQEFGHVDAYPKRSVCTISTHDMAPLRLWWEESPERTQRYYITMLQKEGRAPQQLPAHLAEEIIARHLYCPSCLCILQLQDWLAMDVTLRGKDIRSERINLPSDPYNRWQWRMHLTIEELLEATKYNNKVRTMITRSRRV